MQQISAALATNPHSITHILWVTVGNKNFSQIALLRESISRVFSVVVQNPALSQLNVKTKIVWKCVEQKENCLFFSTLSTFSDYVTMEIAKLLMATIAHTFPLADISYLLLKTMEFPSLGEQQVGMTHSHQ